MKKEEMQDIIRAKIEQAFEDSMCEIYDKMGLNTGDIAPWDAICLELDLDQMAERLSCYTAALVEENSFKRGV